MGPVLKLWRTIRKHLNFYRVHILFFTFTPLIFSVIFWGSNGRYRISYIDALFNCVSAMTVCGLATIDLSQLTPWQQVILFIQMCLGSPVVVSWVMVYLRKYYFEQKFEHIIEAAASRKGLAIPKDIRSSQWPHRIISFLMRGKGKGLPVVVESSSEEGAEQEPRNTKRLRPDMIRRMDDAPKLVNPSGWIIEGTRIPMRRSGTIQSTQDPSRHLAFVEPSPERSIIRPVIPSSRRMPRRLSDPGTPSRPTSPSTLAAPMHRYETVAAQSTASKFPRTQTVEFSSPLPRRRARIESVHESDDEPIRPGPEPVQPDERRSRRMSILSHPLTSHTTNHTYSTYQSGPKGTKHSGFGGFPMPHEILQSLFKKFFPNVGRKLTRTVTIPLTTTIASQRGDNAPAGAKIVPYISFDTVVGRNSAFPMLTDEQLEELGGVEYRALNALLWIVAGYHFGVQLLAYVVIAPYISTNRWHDVFIPPAVHRPVAAPWFSLFQVVSAYTNTGMSLVDASMVPFQRAYPMIVFMIILILAGNTAFPIFLRFTIWILSKLVPPSSRANETLHFLLDHPRRCFIYLFPSHQTWFLLTIVLALNLTDWFFFMVLDIGTPAIEAIPLNVRFAIGLLQATAVRAAGFGTVTIAALAPAVKVLYVIMMYISVYPIALSVRSTNVYEEQSLGVFRDVDEDSDGESEVLASGSRVTVWSRYLAMHARKQLAFDMWWLGLALFLLCIIERPNIDDEANAVWFNIFSIVFELVSAYGTVGLSLGIPTANYSFSGALRPLSKLIICFVMLRGRHRGLPVAIDRAVMLPEEFKRRDEVEATTVSHYFQSSSERTPHTPHTNGNSAREKSPNSEEGRRRHVAIHDSQQEMRLEENRERAAREDEEAFADKWG